MTRRTDIGAPLSLRALNRATRARVQKLAGSGDAMRPNGQRLHRFAEPDAAGYAVEVGAA